MAVINYAIELDTGTSVTDASLAMVSGVMRVITGRPEYDGSPTYPTYEAALGGGNNTSVWYEGFLTKGGIGKVSRSVDLSRTGDYGTYSGFSFTFENTSQIWADLRDNDIYLTGKNITLYVVISDVFYQAWKGIVDDNPWNETKYTIRCVDSFHVIHKNIPARTMEETEFPNLPDKSRGKPIPVTLGDIPYAKIFDLGLSTDDDSGLIIKENDSNKYTSGATLLYLDSAYSGYYSDGQLGVKQSNNDSDWDNGICKYYVRPVYNGDTEDVAAVLQNTGLILSLSNGLTKDDEPFYFELFSGTSEAVIAATDITGTGYTNGKVACYYWEENKRRWISVGTQLQNYVSSENSVSGLPVFNKLIFGDNINSTWYTSTEFTTPELTDTPNAYPLGGSGNPMAPPQNPSGPTFGENIYVSMQDREESQTIPTWSVDWPSPYGWLPSYDSSQDFYIYTSFECYPTDISEDIQELYLCCSLSGTMTNLVGKIFDVKYIITGEVYDLQDNKIDDLFTEYEMDTFTTSTTNYGGESTGPGITMRYVEDIDILRQYTLNQSGLKISDDLLSIVRRMGTKAKLRFSVKFVVSLINVDGTEVFTQSMSINRFYLTGKEKITKATEDIYVKVSGESCSTGQVRSVQDAFRYMLESDGIESSDFDLTDINNTRFNWYVARQLTEQKQTFTYIKELCEQSFCALFPTRFGVRKVSDWLNTSASVADYDVSNILRGSLSKVSFTLPRDIYNNIKIKYHRNPETGEYDRAYTITNTDASEFPPLDLGDYDGTVLVDGGAQTGSSLDVDGFDSASGTITSGSIFTIAGVVGQYQLTDDITITGNAATLEFTPALVSSPDDDAAVIFQPNAWMWFVTGVSSSSYSDAKVAWEQLHASYLRTGIINYLPEKLGNLDWYVDRTDFDENETNGTGTNSAPWKYLTNVVFWLSRRKPIVSFSIPVSATNMVRDLTNDITLTDPILTNGETWNGWIQEISVNPKNDTIDLECIFDPNVMDNIDDDYGDIVETGSAPDTITESGSQTDTITEGA